MKKEGEMQFVLRIDEKLVKKLYANQFEKKVDAIPEE